MATHRLHPHFGPWPEPDGPVYADPDDAILFDACERCDQQAERPYMLDTGKLRALWRRTIDVERGDQTHYRTRNEATAGRQLWEAHIIFNRMGLPLADLAGLALDPQEAADA